MRKIFVAGLFCLSLGAFLFAEPKPKNYGMSMPAIQGFESNAVYYTTSTCSNGVLFASTRTALLYSIIVSSGEGDPNVRVYDSRVSTQGIPDAFQIRAATGIARVIMPRTYTAAAQQWFFEVGASSGIAIWNEAVTRTSCVTCIYTEW